MVCTACRYSGHGGFPGGSAAGETVVYLTGKAVLCQSLLFDDGSLYAVSLCDLQYGAVGIACFEEVIQLLDKVGTLAEADAVLFGVEAAGVSEVRIARALADHGGSHERVDDGGIRRTGSHLHQRVRLCGDRRNAVAESVQFTKELYHLDKSQMEATCTKTRNDEASLS